MKFLKSIALLLAILLCVTACGTQTKTNTDTPEPPITEATPTPEETPEAPQQTGSGIPDATTAKQPTKEGETYKSTGIYLGMADNNLLVVIEANPEDGRPEKSYKTASDLNLEKLGITEGTAVDITYTVDNDGVKQLKTITPKK